jgi:hypothetical protein
MSEAARATHGRPQDTLWPHLQPTARQDAAKPLSSHLALGDGRINPFHTSYSNGEWGEGYVCDCAKAIEPPALP